jgi:hypothetical protein
LFISLTEDPLSLPVAFSPRANYTDWATTEDPLVSVKFCLPQSAQTNARIVCLNRPLLLIIARTQHESCSKHNRPFYIYELPPPPPDWYFGHYSWSTSFLFKTSFRKMYPGVHRDLLSWFQSIGLVSVSLSLS